MDREKHIHLKLLMSAHLYRPFQDIPDLMELGSKSSSWSLCTGFQIKCPTGAPLH